MYEMSVCQARGVRLLSPGFCFLLYSNEGEAIVAICASPEKTSNVQGTDPIGKRQFQSQCQNTFHRCSMEQ